MTPPENSRIEYEKHRKEVQRRYATDRPALLEEATWVCPYCEGVLVPTVLDNPVCPGDVFIVRRDHCGCEGEQAAMQVEQEEAEHGRRESMEWKMALLRAGLTDWLATATFSSYEAKTLEQKQRKAKALEYCQKLLADDLGHKSWLVLYGAWGTGKTHLVAAILQNALAKGMSARFRVWSQWLEDLMGTFGGKGDSGGLVRELRGSDIVAIDDIDKQHPTKSGFAEEKLFNALNYRYNLGLPAILTFNHPPGEMEPWLGPALVDRMIERSFASIPFTGPSYRSGLEWGRKDTR